jgi:hypothetical protein
MSLSKVLTDSHSTSALLVTAAASAALIGGLAALITSYPGKSDRQEGQGEDEEPQSPSKSLRDHEEKKVGRIVRSSRLKQQDSIMMGEMPDIPEDEEVDVTQIMQYEIDRQKRKQKQ